MPVDLALAASVAEVAVHQEDEVDSAAVEAHLEVEAAALAHHEAVLVAEDSVVDAEAAFPVVDEAVDSAATEVEEAEDSAVEVAGVADTRRLPTSSSAQPFCISAILVSISCHVLCKSILSAYSVCGQAAKVTRVKSIDQACNARHREVGWQPNAVREHT